MAVYEGEQSRAFLEILEIAVLDFLEFLEILAFAEILQGATCPRGATALSRVVVKK